MVSQLCDEAEHAHVAVLSVLLISYRIQSSYQFVFCMTRHIYASDTRGQQVEPICVIHRSLARSLLNETAAGITIVDCLARCRVHRSLQGSIVTCRGLSSVHLTKSQLHVTGGH